MSRVTSTGARGVDVSVIVPVFNAEPFIQQCLDGLLAQDFGADRFEILMVDNNSTDRGPEIARACNRVTLLHEPRQSSYAARNRGIAKARAPLLAFLDPDCVPHPTWLRILVNAMADPDTMMVSGRVDQGGDSAALRLLSSYDCHKLEVAFGSGDSALYSGFAGNMIARRSLFETIGLFHQDGRGGDTLLALRAAEAFGPRAVGFARKARVRHLEVQSVRDYCRKLFLYGRARQRHGVGPVRRPFSRRERLQILRRTAGDERHSFVASVMLRGVLSICSLSSHAGALAGRRRHRAESPRVRPSSSPVVASRGRPQ